MKIISLWQPWSSLMALGAKRIETRSWGTSYRGPLVIHAAKAWNRDCQDSLYIQPMMKALEPIIGAHSAQFWAQYALAVRGRLPFGAIIAVVNLIDCCPTVDTVSTKATIIPAEPSAFTKYPQLDTPRERAFGNYEPGRWAWVTNHLRVLSEPLPFKGGQGLRDLDPAVAAEVIRRMPHSEVNIWQ